MSRAFPFEYDQQDFPNGLRLITVPTGLPHIVSLQIVVHAGSRNEVEEGRSGFAHFFEHMMFRGTPAFPPERYEAVLQNAGASSNAYTDDDRTVYHSTLTRPDFEPLLAMEADRFQNLRYPEDDFRTEALAVYGEYNKDSAEPVNKLMEVLRDTAFDRHTYKHTTMGFLRDIVRMPEMYDYSLQFFDRFYRPEYTTLVVAGDVKPREVSEMVERYWGSWRRGNYVATPPAEPEQQGPREAVIPWSTPTLPYWVAAFRSPAYDDSSREWAALDLLSFLCFSEISPLYRELVLEEQLCDALIASNADHVDPYLFQVIARIKDPSQVARVQARVIETLEGAASTPFATELLDAARSRLHYGYAMSLDSSDSIGASLAHYVSLKRTPATINRLHESYAAVTVADLQAAAAKIFHPSRRSIVTLRNEA